MRPANCQNSSLFLSISIIPIINNTVYNDNEDQKKNKWKIVRNVSNCILGKNAIFVNTTE